MKKTFLAILLLFSPALYAQSTTVSGTVTDAGAQTWNNGTVQFNFIPLTGNPTGYTWSGGTLTTTLNGTMNGSGVYSISVPSNSAINPAGTTWSLRFCPKATASCYTLANQTITGATQTINATPPAIAIDLINPPSSPVLAYADAEIATAKIGATYYNLTTSLTRVCNALTGTACTSWANLGAGSGGTVTSVTGTAPIVSSGGTTPAISCATCLTTTTGAQLVASGTATLGTSAISSGACATAVTVAATGALTTDDIVADFNADPTSTTGYTPPAVLTIFKYPTSGNVNFKVCNNTASSITPAAVTLNWRVIR